MGGRHLVQFPCFEGSFGAFSLVHSRFLVAAGTPFSTSFTFKIGAGQRAAWSQGACRMATEKAHAALSALGLPLLLHQRFDCAAHRVAGSAENLKTCFQ